MIKIVNAQMVFFGYLFRRLSTNGITANTGIPVSLLSSSLVLIDVSEYSLKTAKVKLKAIAMKKPINPIVIRLGFEGFWGI